MVSEDTSPLETTFMGGGHFANLAPVYKEDGTTIYIAWKNQITGYSCKTGIKVQKFSGLSEDIIGFGAINSNGQECLAACTKTGNILIWAVESCETLIEHQLPYGKIKSFKPILDRATNKSKAIIVFHNTVEKLNRRDKTVQIIAQFAVGLANLRKSCVTIFPIKVTKKDYYIDIGGVEDGTKYLVFAQGRYLHYMELKKNEMGKHNQTVHMLAKPKYFSSVITPHMPQSTPNCFAGSSTGRITLYTDLRERRPIHSILHWHTLPVRALALSKSDTVLYSGGAEAVMVIWGGLYGEGDKKTFIPRMGGTISWIGVGGVDGRVVGIDVEGAGVRIMEEGWEVCWVRRALSIGSSSHAGLVYDNRSKCIILNAISGFVQFYSPAQRSALYSMDVVRHNRLTQERDKTLININVMHVAVNEGGSWYATVEERIDTESIYELRLKFWKFDAETQNFHLNTSIEYPHEESVLGIKFRPNRTGNKLDQCVTIARDGLFKNWHLVEIAGVDGARSLTWRCATTAYYKPPFRALDLCFSEDGSVLALAYGPAITIWLPDTCQLKRSLTYDNSLTGTPRRFDFILSVAFGSSRCNYLIVAITKRHVMVWNLLTYSLTMRLEMKIAALIPDPSSSIMAILKRNNTVFFFEPDRSDPIKEFKIPEATMVKYCTFVPLESNFENSKRSKIKSQFFYLNSKQELFCLGSKQKNAEITTEVLQMESSNFSRILAEKLTTSVKKQEHRRIIHENTNKKSELKRLLDTPNHTQLPLSLLACSFLHSLVLNERTSSSHQNPGETAPNTANKIEYGPAENGIDIANSTGSNPGTFINLNKLIIKHTNWVNSI